MSDLPSWVAELTGPNIYSGTVAVGRQPNLSFDPSSFLVTSDPFNDRNVVTVTAAPVTAGEGLSTTGGQLSLNVAAGSNITLSSGSGTQVVITSIAPPTPVGGGWINSTLGTTGTFDFRNVGTLALATDGTYAISGTTFTKFGSAFDLKPMSITQSVGLVIVPTSTSRWDQARTAGVLFFNLSQIIPGYDTSTPVEITCYWTQRNISANFDCVFTGLDTGTQASINWRAGRQFNSAQAQSLSYVFGNAANSNLAVGSPLDTVDCFRLPLGAQSILGQLLASTGSYVTGSWPDLIPRMTHATIGDQGWSGPVNNNGYNVVIGAQRQGSATPLSATLAAIRVRYK